MVTGIAGGILEEALEMILEIKIEWKMAFDDTLNRSVIPTGLNIQ